jgi:hypothetical protein
MLPALIGLFFGLTRTASADLAPPFFPPAKVESGFKIEVDEKAKSPKLIIPSGIFAPPRVRPGPRPKATEPSEPKGELPVDNGDGIASETPNQSGHHMLIAGMALTLSMTFGGFWLVRRKSISSTKTTALLVVAGLSLGVGTFVWANGAPPPRIPAPKTPSNLPVLLDTKVQVEFANGNEPIRLIIDKETLEKLKKEPKAPEKPTKPEPK